MKKMFVCSSLVIFIFSCIFSGCKTFSNDPEPPIISITDNYYGSANLLGTAYNIKLTVEPEDTLGNLDGQIIYGNDTLHFVTLSANSDKDTLWFSYTRASVLYQAWATVGSNGLYVTYSEPSNINSFRLNRRMSGYNLSGIWFGPMSSAALGGQRNAQMTYNQEGVLFSGNATVSLSNTTVFDFRSGIFNGQAFQISGFMRIGSSSFPTLFYGNYEYENQIHGYWSAGSNGEVDNGEFLFVRSYN